MTPSSTADSLYTSGEYFADPTRGSGDASFKAQQFLRAFLPVASGIRGHIRSYADVGCGSGTLTIAISEALVAAGFTLQTAKGYDVSPHVERLSHPAVSFVNADFSCTPQGADLVTLFDVFEHVPAPVDFLRQVAARALIVGMHIPLDDNMNCKIRDLFGKKLINPGHLYFMDVVSALNTVAAAGLRVVSYHYTFTFEAPSGHASLISRLSVLPRKILARISPWLLSKTLGGASLLVIALTPRGVAAGLSYVGGKLSSHIESAEPPVVSSASKV